MQLPPRRTRSAPPETLESCLKRLRAATAAAARSNPTFFRPVSDRGHASVVALLFDCRDDPRPRVLLTRRANQLRAHSGEVALPGGRRDAEDVARAATRGDDRGSVDAVTALREAEEEVGLKASDVDVVAELRPVISKHLLSVAVVVATLKKQPESVRSLLDSLKPSAEEVDAVFEAPLDHFIDLPFSMSKTTTTTTTYRHRDARFGRVPTAPRFRLHFFEMRDRPCVFSDSAETKREDEFLVWGLTALILIGVAEASFGRPASFDVSPPRAAPYWEICCFRDKNGGQPTTFRELDAEEREKQGTKKRIKR